MPLSFEPNQGQAASTVQFLSRGSGYELFLTPGKVVLKLERQPSVSAAATGQTPGAASVDTLRMSLVGTNAKAKGVGPVFLDGKFAADPSNGPAFRNAVPGELVQLYATGLAPSRAGTLVSTTLLSGVTVTIGSVTIPAAATALVTVGEFQINFIVPRSFASQPAGLYPISISINGVSSPGSVVIPIQP